jgi:hypothetical protein
VQYRIIFDPQIELSPEEFVENWNTSKYSDDTQSVARISSDETSVVQFLSPEALNTILISAAVSIPAAVIANLATEILKQKFFGKSSPQITIIKNQEEEKVLIVSHIRET